MKGSDGKFSCNKILEERVFSYITDEMKSQVIANKYSRSQAAQAVAGDFDGDGKTEFAVVFKDDVASQNNINVTVYKWNNGSFTKANNKVSYDGKNSAWNAYVTVNVSALGLKAARLTLTETAKMKLLCCFSFMRTCNHMPKILKAKVLRCFLT